MRCSDISWPLISYPVPGFLHTHSLHATFLKRGSVVIISNLFTISWSTLTYIWLFCVTEKKDDWMKLQEGFFLLLLFLLISKERRSSIPERLRSELHSFIQLPADFKGLHYKIKLGISCHRIHTLVIKWSWSRSTGLAQSVENTSLRYFTHMNAQSTILGRERQ